MSGARHIPVLLNEVIKVLGPKEGEFFIDGTFGAGGHSAAIKEKIGDSGKLLTIDWDKTGENFADLPKILKEKNLSKADGLILDLGFSSEQLSAGRGFSFHPPVGGDEPLLMTYNIKAKPVKEILKELSAEELAKIIRDYSQERFAKEIAKAIKAQENIKPVETTQELTNVIQKSVPKNYERGRIHPATRTFMALRIYANRELENFEEVLKNVENILKLGGRIAIISFHSLEDRLVKNYFRKYVKEGKMKILTKKPIIASREEIANNPRSRSAKLRAAQML